jgi:hypothetical protein
VKYAQKNYKDDILITHLASNSVPHRGQVLNKYFLFKYLEDCAVELGFVVIVLREKKEIYHMAWDML